MRKPHVMLFDLSTGGHHGQYVRQLADYWARHRLEGTLDIVVPERFLQIHGDLGPALDEHRDAGVRVSAFDAETSVPVHGAGRQVHADWRAGRILREQIERIRPDCCVLLYMDRFQLALSLDLRFDFPVRLSGIYFRPSFHYRHIGAGDRGLGARWRGELKRHLLRAALRNPHFDTLFSLDPFVLPFLRPVRAGVKTVHLPDGIVPRPQMRCASDIRKALEIDPERKMLLLFGVLDERKGYLEVLEAMRRLPEETCRRIALTLVGPVASEIRDAARERLTQLRAAGSLQIVERDEFVPDERVQDILRAADLALLTYQRHVGSSMVLVRAAHAQVPVLGPSYGAVGATIRERRLGYAVDTTDPAAIAATIREFLQAPERPPFDAAAAKRYALENTDERMGAVFFGALGVRGAGAGD